MEIRDAFELADQDKEGSLDEKEFIDAFSGVIGKELGERQLR